MLVSFLWVGLCYSLVAANWEYRSIGDVTETHFYYEDEELKGICVASEDGVVAMLDPQSGEIVWQNYPVEGRTINRFTAKGQCKCSGIACRRSWAYKREEGGRGI